MSLAEVAAQRKALRSLAEYESAITIQVENVVHKFRERAKVVHSEIDGYVSNVISELKQKLQAEIHRIRSVMDSLRSELNSPMYESTPRSDQLLGKDEADRSETFIELQKFGRKSKFDKKEAVFFEGEVSAKTLSKLIGTYILEDLSPIPLTTARITHEASQRTETKILRSFRCGEENETVHAIGPVSSDTAYACCGWGTRKLNLFKRDGQKIQSTTLNIQVNDITAFFDGKKQSLLVSSYKEKSIKMLDMDTLKTSDFAYISLFPGGICSDGHKNIYVCLRDNYQRPVSFGSRRMVAKLSSHGEILSAIEKDKEQHNIFGYPFRVAVNINGDICVSDYGDGTRGVNILTKEWKLRCTYKGPVGKTLEKPFLPHGICCDSKGHILVSDWNNDCVHVLDYDGQFLLFLFKKKDGIEGPNAIALDGDGYLWVGDSRGKIHILKYSILRD
ncbi:hypothetical protein ACJMK2_038000 [Sinanodonta woodiana]|uniref:Tripartite motif-containing protein 2 n=1 Tax=Sinanodonta woodiana TaxID=1069815 RepID=A0ABD3WQP5_SINWO